MGKITFGSLKEKTEKMDRHLLNNFALHNEPPISTRSKVVDVKYEKSGKKNFWLNPHK